MVSESAEWPLAGAISGSGLILRLDIEMDLGTQNKIVHSPKPHKEHDLIKRQLNYHVILISYYGETA